MKKLQFLVCFLLLSVASYAADRTIQLPKPDMNRAGLLMKALSERHSTREYASKALSNTDLSDYSGLPMALTGHLKANVQLRQP